RPPRSLPGRRRRVPGRAARRAGRTPGGAAPSRPRSSPGGLGARAATAGGATPAEPAPGGPSPPRRAAVRARRAGRPRRAARAAGLGLSLSACGLVRRRAGGPECAERLGRRIGAGGVGRVRTAGTHGVVEGLGGAADGGFVCCLAAGGRPRLGCAWRAAPAARWGGEGPFGR